MRKKKEPYPNCTLISDDESFFRDLSPKKELGASLRVVMKNARYGLGNVNEALRWKMITMSADVAIVRELTGPLTAAMKRIANLLDPTGSKGRNKPRRAKTSSRK